MYGFESYGYLKKWVVDIEVLHGYVCYVMGFEEMLFVVEIQSFLW